MLAATSAKVLTWYYKSRNALDDPVGLRLDTARQLWELIPTARARENLLAEVCTVGLALSRLPVAERLILECTHNPDRRVTDRELASALHTDRDGARTAHLEALVALGHQLVKAGLISMNGHPSWSAH